MFRVVRREEMVVENDRADAIEEGIRHGKKNVVFLTLAVHFEEIAVFDVLFPEDRFQSGDGNLQRKTLLHLPIGRIAFSTAGHNVELQSSFFRSNAFGKSMNTIREMIIVDVLLKECEVLRFRFECIDLRSWRSICGKKGIETDVRADIDDRTVRIVLQPG